MSRNIQITNVALGTVLGAAIAFSIGAVGQRTAPTLEYKFLYQTIAHTQDIEVQLNAAATQGWEAVGYVLDGGNRHVLLKRVKQ